MYSYIVVKIDLPEHETGDVDSVKGFDSIDDAVSYCDELNKDDDSWFEVIVNKVNKAHSDRG